MSEDESLLSEMIAAIDRADEFPLTEEEKRCRFCSYRSLCDRGGAGLMADFDFDEHDEQEERFELDFDQIAEIEF